MITFDLQQNLPTPNLNHNGIFYLRQLWTYNFGIHDYVTEKGFMFKWHEAMAKRGASEISSCLYSFFQPFRIGARSLVSYSDSCGGLNKNLTILGLLSDLHLANTYQSIDHLYLEKATHTSRMAATLAPLRRENRPLKFTCLLNGTKSSEKPVLTSPLKSLKCSRRISWTSKGSLLRGLSCATRIKVASTSCCVKCIG